MTCNQCEALMINGVFCHETGCPNTHKVYNRKTKEWEDEEVEAEEDDGTLECLFDEEADNN